MERRSSGGESSCRDRGRVETSWSGNLETGNLDTCAGACGGTLDLGDISDLRFYRHVFTGLVFTGDISTPHFCLIPCYVLLGEFFVVVVHSGWRQDFCHRGEVTWTMATLHAYFRRYRPLTEKKKKKCPSRERSFLGSLFRRSSDG